MTSLGKCLEVDPVTNPLPLGTTGVTRVGRTTSVLVDPGTGLKRVEMKMSFPTGEEEMMEAEETMTGPEGMRKGQVVMMTDPGGMMMRDMAAGGPRRWSSLQGTGGWRES